MRTVIVGYLHPIMNKLRAKIKEKRDQLPSENVDQLGEAIFRNILASNILKDKKRIAIYYQFWIYKPLTFHFLIITTHESLFNISHFFYPQIDLMWTSLI